MNKENLLVIPCGQNSLHQQWKELHNDFNFDLCLLIYDDTQYKDHNSKSAKYVFKRKAYKWSNIANFITKSLYRPYKYIGIIDDDILTNITTINNLFDYGKRLNFDLFQPALSHDSYFSHSATLQISNADFHLLNTVEIMNPFFSNRAFNICSNEFDIGPYGQGYGLELSWQALLSPREGISIFGGLVGVIDKYPVIHTKPVTSFPYSDEETDFFRARYKGADINFTHVIDRQIKYVYKES
jgi:hypothetical protein